MANDKITQDINGGDIISKSYYIINKNFNALNEKLNLLEKRFNRIITESNGTFNVDIHTVNSVGITTGGNIKINTVGLDGNEKEITSTKSIIDGDYFASSTKPGTVSTTEQQFKGLKTFLDGIQSNHINSTTLLNGTQSIIPIINIEPVRTIENVKNADFKLTIGGNKGILMYFNKDGKLLSVVYPQKPSSFEIEIDDILKDHSEEFKKLEARVTTLSASVDNMEKNNYKLYKIGHILIWELTEGSIENLYNEIIKTQAIKNIYKDKSLYFNNCIEKNDEFGTITIDIFNVLKNDIDNIIVYINGIVNGTANVEYIEINA